MCIIKLKWVWKNILLHFTDVLFKSNYCTIQMLVDSKKEIQMLKVMSFTQINAALICIYSKNCNTVKYYHLKIGLTLLFNIL